MSESVRTTLIFSAIAIAVGLGGCIFGFSSDGAPSIVFGSVALAGGVILAFLSVLAHRKTRL